MLSCISLCYIVQYICLYLLFESENQTLHGMWFLSAKIPSTYLLVLIFSFIGEKVEDIDEADIKDLSEEDKIAQLGKPRLGEITKITCHIRESLEFKVGIVTPMKNILYNYILSLYLFNSAPNI